MCEWFDGRNLAGLIISHRLSVDGAMDCMDCTMDETVDRCVDWGVDWGVNWGVR